MKKKNTKRGEWRRLEGNIVSKVKWIIEISKKGMRNHVKLALGNPITDK